MIMNRRQFSSRLFVGAFALMTLGIASCNKDKDEVTVTPVVPKTDAEILAELKEELRTSMKYNSNYKQLQYSSNLNPDFKAAKDFSESLKSIQWDHNENKYMASNLVIDKKAKLYFSVGGSYYFFENFGLKKENDLYTITAKLEDMFQITQEGNTTKPTGMGFSMSATYNVKTGKTIQILEAMANETVVMVIASVWVQDKSITKPTKSPVGKDPNDFIDF